MLAHFGGGWWMKVGSVVRCDRAWASKTLLADDISFQRSSLGVPREGSDEKEGQVLIYHGAWPESKIEVSFREVLPAFLGE